MELKSETSNNQVLTPYQQNVEFINQQVLQPINQPMDTGSRLIAEQAAALMVEDMRSFLQGCEQILTIAMAQAAKLATNEATVAQGTVAITSVTQAMAALPTYATNIATSAGCIVSAFSSTDSPPPVSSVAWPQAEFSATPETEVKPIPQAETPKKRFGLF